MFAAPILWFVQKIICFVDFVSLFSFLVGGNTTPTQYYVVDDSSGNDDINFKTMSKSTPQSERMFMKSNYDILNPKLPTQMDHYQTTTVASPTTPLTELIELKTKSKSKLITKENLKILIIKSMISKMKSNSKNMHSNKSQMLKILKIEYQTNSKFNKSKNTKSKLKMNSMQLDKQDRKSSTIKQKKSGSCLRSSYFSKQTKEPWMWVKIKVPKVNDNKKSMLVSTKSEEKLIRFSSNYKKT